MTITAKITRGITYQDIFIDGSRIASIWGEVTDVEKVENTNLIAVYINKTDAFIYVDEVEYRTLEVSLEEALKELTTAK